MDFNELPIPLAFSEYFGVLMITMAVNFASTNNTNELAAFLPPLAVFLAIFLFSYISNALFNGSIVLLDLMVKYSKTKNLEWKKALVFTGAHILGIYSAMIYFYLFTPGITTGPSIPTGVSYWQAGLYEFYFTLLLCIVSLICWDDTYPPEKKTFSPFLFAIVVASAIIAIGPYTGASLNPTLWFGIKSFRLFINGDFGELEQILPYWISQFAASLLGYVIFKIGLKQMLEKYGNNTKGENKSMIKDNEIIDNIQNNYSSTVIISKEIENHDVYHRLLNEKNPIENNDPEKNKE